MVDIIFWVCFATYAFVGVKLQPRFAIAAKKSHDEEYNYITMSPLSAAWSGLWMSTVWPLFFIVERSTKAVEKDLELQKAIDKVRKDIEQEKRTTKRKAQKELDDFDRKLRGYDYDE